MKKIIFIIMLAVSLITGTACAAEWVNISGTVTYKFYPLNAMILANGQHMFTDPADGGYELKVPLNEDGRITLFSFCDGFEPFRQTLTPRGAEYHEISMVPTRDSKEMTISYVVEPASSADRVKIRGVVLYDGRKQCAMVLANGQHAFTCTWKEFELEVTPNENGEITLLGFCDDFAPFKEIIAELPDLSKDYDGDGYSVNSGDCNDTDSYIHPGAPDICGDGTDQDCDGIDPVCPPPDPPTEVMGTVYEIDEMFPGLLYRAYIYGARVSLLPAGSDQDTSSGAPELGTELHTYTDRLGDYEFTGLPEGEYECRMVVEAEGYEAQESVVKIVNGPNNRDMEMIPSLTCFVNNECPEKMFCAKSQGDCDGKGMCRSKIRYCSDFVWEICGCDGWTYITGCYAAKNGVNMAYKGRCVPGPESGSLSGYVLYNSTAGCAAEGCIVPYAQVSVKQIFPPDSSDMFAGIGSDADEKGFYSLNPLPAGEYRISVISAGYKVWEGFTSITAGEKVQDIYLTPIIAESVLRGHVYDGSVTCIGETCTSHIANAIVSIHYWQPDIIDQIPLETDHYIVTDNNGYYEFSYLPVGDYDMTVAVEWYQPWWKKIKITDGENVLDVYLMPYSSYR